MTMKATDLRVGNYLRNPANGDLLRVHSVYRNSVIAHAVDDVLKECVLTPETGFGPVWLDKVWVKDCPRKDAAGRLHIIGGAFGNFVEVVNDGGRWFILMGSEPPCWNDMPFRLQHVHQLQNLWHALTGEGLELTPRGL